MTDSGRDEGYICRIGSWSETICNGRGANHRVTILEWREGNDVSSVGHGG